jgi:hypothetical protein
MPLPPSSLASRWMTRDDGVTDEMPWMAMGGVLVERRGAGVAGTDDDDEKCWSASGTDVE